MEELRIEWEVGADRLALTEDMLDALIRFNQDIYTVGAAASEHCSRYDRAVLTLILRRAAYGAIAAFTTDDARRDAAWRLVVILVDEVLHRREQFRSALDEAERRRLQAFVDENSDAFECAATPQSRPEIARIAV